MTAITLADIQIMQDEDEVEKVAFEFLGLFEKGKPLQDDTFKKWKQRCRVKVEQIKKATKFALESGWILEETSGIYLTVEGQHKREG